MSFKKYLENYKLKVLKSVIASQIAIESLDEIKETSLWVRGTKQLGNRFIKCLTPTGLQFDTIYKENPQLTNDLSSNYNDLLDKIVKSNMVDIAMINQIAQHYFDNKKEWEVKFPLKFKELNT